MFIRTIMAVMTLALTGACASSVVNPISNEIVTSYKAGAVSVSLADDQKIPDRYDEAAREYFSNRANDIEKTEFEAFVNDLDSSIKDDTDYTGEAFLTWMIQRQLAARLSTGLQGEAETDLQLELKSTTWPNAATMMLVGEIIGTSFEFTLSDANDIAIVESVDTVSPIVPRSAGAGGGLLGMALRSGDTQHLSDLQRVATATTNHVLDILTASELPSTTLKTYKYNGTVANELHAAE